MAITAIPVTDFNPGFSGWQLQPVIAVNARGRQRLSVSPGTRFRAQRALRFRRKHPYTSI